MKQNREKARDIYNRWSHSMETAVLRECISDLEGLLPEEDNSGEVPYIMGLLVYDRECEEDGDTDLALEHFVAAVQRNPKHYMAHLYSGHCHHDKRRYPEALQEYGLVDTELLRQEYPLWRYVKLQEQKGECLFLSGQQSEAIEMFEEVASFYDSNPYDDLVDPDEALRALGRDHPISIRLKGHMEQYYGTDG